jgi:ArsR family transcriptional regulator, zinc-responsive transcriptional repressor
MENMKPEEKAALKRYLSRKAEILKNMAHPVRLCILVKLLRDGPCNVGGLQGCLDVTQPTISQNLGKLKAAGIVSAERNGKEVIYRISDEPVRRIIEALL